MGVLHTLLEPWGQALAQALAPRVAPLAPHHCHSLQASPHLLLGSALTEPLPVAVGPPAELLDCPAELLLS